MSEAGENTGSASPTDWDVWIIDDDIPIHRAGFADDDMKAGKRPIDRGTLLYLLSSENRAYWSDNPLRELCTQLIHAAGCVTAFLHPSSAVLHLERGAPIPDVVIFDWEYRNTPVGASPQDLLETMLTRCVSVVQVYTKEDTKRVAGSLKLLLSKYGTRLEAPRGKAETNAGQLVKVMADRLKRSLSARLARKIRSSSLAAVEDVLIRIDDLPLDVAIRLLAGVEVPEELQLSEMLSTKVGEALESSRELTEVVEEFVKEKGVPRDRVEGAVREAVALLSANVREHVLYDGELFTEIESAWEEARHTEAKRDNAEIKQIVRRFFAFRLYDQPKDDMVRTGDIVTAQSIDVAAQELPDLYLVITPPCDLVGFWKKTRGHLTLVSMCPLTPDRGIIKTQNYGNSRFQLSNSITARHPLVMPSVPVGNDKQVDYALFAYELRFEKFENPDLVNAGKDNRGFHRPLIYAELKGRIRRKCRVSEPFLSGVLAELSSTLFRPGIPDYPVEEKKRLHSLFASKS